MARGSRPGSSDVSTPSDSSVTVELFPRDQSCQLERFGDRDAADLPRGHLGEDEVVARQRLPDDASRVTLRGRRCSSPGPSGQLNL
jgi:hypothetical protein